MYNKFRVREGYKVTPTLLKIYYRKVVNKRLLLDKEININLNPKTIKWFESKGYKIPRIKDDHWRKVVKRGTKILVKVEDLKDTSIEKVRVICDGCGKILTPLWHNYKKYAKENGKYYCQECASNGYSKLEKISTTHPYLLKYFVNQEDCYKYSVGSSKIVPLKCPNCEYIKTNMRITTLSKYGFACPKCSDGISYPQKFMFNFLERLLGKSFDVELGKTTFKWCNNYKYDFYIKKINCIIETHGEQHYKENTNWKISLIDVQNNDIQKEKLAKENNIQNYIVLDCRESNMEWIKNSIMQSELPNLLNFKEEDIDWLKCHEYACSSRVKEVCDIWEIENIKDTEKISLKTKLNRSTIINYLKQGVKLGWCNYSPLDGNKKNLKIANEKRRKKVICLTTGEIFNSLTDASIKYNVNRLTISLCCKGKRKSSGKHPETRERLTWSFYDNTKGGD